MKSSIIAWMASSANKLDYVLPKEAESVIELIKTTKERYRLHLRRVKINRGLNSQDIVPS